MPPDAKARLAVALGVAQGWQRWVGDAGDIVSIDRYGASVPAAVLLEHYSQSTRSRSGRANCLRWPSARGEADQYVPFHAARVPAWPGAVRSAAARAE